ncbi:MAG: HD domain-containing protein [Spirochaetaceae bacterium]|nr:HD domain-containing protein [Spirochaetaceae bacterium]
MIISLVIRFKTNTSWFYYKTVSMTIEFLIWILVEFAIVRTAKGFLNDNYKRKKQIHNIQLNLISGFANLVEAKDTTTGHHIKRISAYVKLICEELKKIPRFQTYLTSENIERIVSAAPLHDLGKIAIPDAILCKTTVLTSDEFNLIKQHPLMGDQLIRDNMSSIEDAEYIRIARDVALHHHEWWNGNGYPDGLSGRNIPLCARIISTADVLDALLSKRPYKDGYTIDKTYEIISSLAGIQFDPDIIGILPKIKNEIEEIANDDSGRLAEKYVSLD